MIITKDDSVYKAFGLSIMSKIALPELPLATEADYKVDVVIEKADLTKQWAELSVQNKRFCMKDDLVMFRVKELAVFAVRGGNNISFSPLKGFSESHVRLFILGISMAVLLMQRKTLTLHGSALARDGKAFAIVGSSGAGKSTLASAFMKRGYQFISDDLIPLTFNDKNIPFVTPGFPHQKLWLESLNQFDMKANQFVPLKANATKYAVPVTTHFVTEKLPLSGIFELVKTKSNEITINQVDGLTGFHTLLKNTFCKSLLVRLGLMEWHFRTITNFSNKVDSFQLKRPVSRFTAYDLADLVEDQITKGERTNDQGPKAYYQSIS